MYKKLFLLIFLTLVLGCKGENEITEANKTLKPTDVKVTVVGKSGIKDEFSLPGLVEAWDVVSVSTEITGHVKSIYKNEGDRVRAGEAVLKVIAPNVDANLQSAKVQYESAKKDYKRALELRKEGAITQKYLEDSENHLQLMEVNYSLAKDMYDKTFAVSPINGIVDEVMPETGELVPAGQPVSRVVQADKLKIYLSIPEKDIPYVKPNQEVYIYPDDNGDEKSAVKASIGYVSTMSNPATLTYKTRVDTLPREDLRAGKIVRVKLLRKEYKDVIVAPLYSVMDVDGRKIVYIEDDGLARQIEIKIGAMIGSEVIIDSGLKPGDRLITTGQQFLSDNFPVKVIE